MITYLSLFAGAGGFDLGADQAGWQCIGQVEWDKHAQSVLRRHWPDVPKWADVRDFHATMSGPADVIVGGFPCQDVSVAGKRAGLGEGTRSGLYAEIIRIIKEMRDATNNEFPRAVILENVKGLLSIDRGEGFRAVLEDLADSGAHLIEWAVLDSQFFGVPQRRQRVFVAAIFDPRAAGNCPDPLFPVSESVPRDFVKNDKARSEVTGSLTSRFGTRGADAADAAEGWLVPEDGVPDTVSTVQAHYSKSVDAESAADGLLVPEPFDVASPLEARYAKGANAESAAGNHLIYDPGVIGPLTASGMSSTKGTESVESNHVLVVPEPFVKKARAQTADGYETWADGHPAPTLNAFDNATETRATIIAIDTAPPISFNWANGGGYGDAHDGLGITVDGTGPILANNQPAVAIHSSETDNGTFWDGGQIADCIDVSSAVKSQRMPDKRRMFAVIQQSAVRRLTPKETERLQGWPDDHTRYADTGKEIADSNRYRMVGNGISSPVARWVATHVGNALTL